MWAHSLLLPLLSVVLTLPGSFGYSSGAPPQICNTLTPQHRYAQPQESSPPATVNVESDGNGKIRVHLSSSPAFKGFVIQARSRNDKNKIVQGTFTYEKEVSKTLDCPEGSKNTLTHANPNPKRRIQTEWTAAPGVDQDVIFRATVVEAYDRFWTEIDSAPVRVKGAEGSNEKGEYGSSNSMYSSCGLEKGCFGLPADCVNREDCEALVSYASADSGILFQLEGFIPASGYLATGISMDPGMIDTSVTGCFLENGRIIAQNSWNLRRDNVALDRVEDYTSTYTNGLASCTWVRPYETTVQGNTFNLMNTSYYILIAKGNVREGGGSIGYHTVGRIASANPVNLTAFEYIGSAGVPTAIKIHGTFMITAWIGFVSLGILLARHFKNVWENKTLAGQKVWFTLHRSFMILALAFVVVAFIVIFVYNNGWNDTQNSRNPHAVLGCVATALGLFQPIMAAFRPSPHDSKRPIFNWLHWAVGNAAQILAVVTIFFARSLEAAGLNESFYWVMAVFVVVHCFFHFVFQLHAWSLEKKKNNEIKMLEMASGRTGSSLADNRQKTISGNVFRVLLLGVYGIFLAVIVFALYALIGVA